MLQYRKDDSMLSDNYKAMTVDQFICRLMTEQDHKISKEANSRRHMRLKGLRNSMPAWLAATQMERLDVSDCKSYKDHLFSPSGSSIGKERSERSSISRFNEFRRLLDEAIGRNAIKQPNPAGQIALPKPMGSRRSGAISPNDIFLEEELRALLHHLSGNNDRPDLYMCLALMALTGLKVTEAVAIRRRDISLTFWGKEGIRPLIRVRSPRRDGRGTKRQRDYRIVDLSPSLVSLLTQWLGRLSPKPNARLFPCPLRPNEALRCTEVVHAWRRALRILPPTRRLPLGALRDTYAAYLIDHKEDVVHVGLFLGYASVRPVEKRYKHWITRHSRGKVGWLHQKIGFPDLAPIAAAEATPATPRAA